MFTPRFFMLAGMVASAAVARLIPHPWNFTPVSAMALFGGAYFTNKKSAFAVPFAALLISDLVIGFYSTIHFVYASFALIVLIGFTLRGAVSAPRVIRAALTSSILFFVITNFGDWLALPVYPKTFSGLLMCYSAGIPFFRNMILGDLFYAGLLFGAFALAERRFPALQKA